MSDENDNKERERRKEFEHRIKKRDQRIKKSLLSKKKAERKHGMTQVDKELRRPVAKVLKGLAHRCKNPGYGILINQRSGKLVRSTYSEVWQETMRSMWRNVKRGKFRGRGSLLSYLVKIATRRTLDLARKLNKAPEAYDSPLQLELFPTNPEEKPTELLDEIEIFYKRLGQEDRAILEAGITASIKNGTDQVIKKDLIENLKIIIPNPEKDWDERSINVLVRNFKDLREELREFLSNR